MRAPSNEYWQVRFKLLRCGDLGLLGRLRGRPSIEQQQSEAAENPTIASGAT